MIYQPQSQETSITSTSGSDLTEEQLPHRAQFVTELQQSEVYAHDYLKIEGGMEGLFALDSKILDEQLSRLSDLKEHGNVSILDAMMGQGRHLVQVVSFYEERGLLDKVRIVGNDFNPSMVAIAQDSLAERGQARRVDLTNDDVRRLSSHSDNSYDLVISLFGSLGMIPDHTQRLRAVTEFARVLKPGGVLLVHAHNLLGNFGIPDRFPEATIKSIRDSSPYLPHDKVEAACDALLGQDSSHVLDQLFNPAPRFDEAYELGDMIYPSRIGRQLQHVFLPEELAELLRDAGLTVLERKFLCNGQSELHPSREIPEALSFINRDIFEGNPELFSEGMIFVATKI